MKPMARAALVTSLRDRLADHGSWTGETHLQKGTFFLQAGTRVPLGFDFILYKFGPFSFDFRDELAYYRSAGFMGLDAQQQYGPRLTTTEEGHSLQGKFPKTLSRFAERLDAVASFLGSRGVGDLERLGTALLFQREDPSLDDFGVANRICDVKPHVDYEEAVEACREVREFLSMTEALQVA